MTSFCECESADCRHRGETCKQKKGLALHRVAGIRQTLCPDCSETAEQFCDAYGYSFEKLVSESAAARRRAWHAGDWFCAGVVLATVVWLVFEILPAFVDGRVAMAVGR